MDLRIDPEELNACVQCGLCLPHCPTWRVTGDETMSPRGRIALMRAVQDHDAPVTDEVVRAFETCVQCRGCEPACPSGVPYGHLIEATRHTLADEGRITPRWQRAAMAPLTNPTLLRLGSTALAAAARVGLTPGRLGLPDDLPFRRPPLRTSGDDVYLFTGCVMDVWQRDVHLAAQRVLEAAGLGVTPTGDAAPCCGALHAHAGLHDEAGKAATTVMTALGDHRPVLVDSAGCGAAMKEYDHLVGGESAASFAAQVFDVSEWIADHALPRLIEALGDRPPLDLAVVVQDPCHLRHVQRAHLATRTVLAPFVREVIELEDDGLCCGAGGAYSVLEPELAGAIRERKVAGIDAADGDVVASANPGCSMHLAAAGLTTVHPIQLVDAALHGTDLPNVTDRSHE